VEQALGHLLSGTVDGLIFPEPIVWKVADTIGLEHRIKRAGLPLQEIKRAMGVSVRRTALLARLNLAIEELVQSAEYHEIYAKWYGTAPSIWSDETVWWAIGGAFGGVVLLMAGWRYQGVLRLNRQLRAESRERARAEEQLRQAQKMEAVGRLAGGVAHDFNNMLQIIQGYVELAMARIGAEHPAHPDLEKVLRASGQATALTRQLLAFSRREALVLRAVDVNDLIDEQSAMLRRLIGEDIELLTVPGAGPLQVRADAGMLGQVLMNLAINARDAMPGGGRIVIETQPFAADADFCRTHTWARRGSYVRLSVADTGVGMSPEVQRRIFDPFFTSKEAGRGTGLGLSMVYGIVQQHEGMISVYSEEGVGTTFHIYLPRSDSEAPPGEAAEHGPAPGGTETILVAEDEPDVLGLLVGLLQGAGYTVLTALDGAEAIERFRDGRERIELVVLDVVMPKLGGRAAYEQIRRMGGAVPILFSSGHTANVIDAEFIAEHSARLIRKPYSPDALLRLVRETLDEAQGRGRPAGGAAG
jgi:signal transduction histidine kinase/CheY-like chemotaxis protein